MWYVDHCHSKFADNGCPISHVFKQFQGYSRCKELRHNVPVINRERLQEITEDLISVLSLPSMSPKNNKSLAQHTDSLTVVFSKYKDRLRGFMPVGIHLVMV